MEYLFDVKLFASFRIEAPDVRTARKYLKEALDCASVNAGCYGDAREPLVGEASEDGEADLVEVDGAPADNAWDDRE